MRGKVLNAKEGGWSMPTRGVLKRPKRPKRPERLKDFLDLKDPKELKHLKELSTLIPGIEQPPLVDAVHPHPLRCHLAPPREH